MTVVERASFEELLDFANKVRAAGGGNPLSALMPAVPENENQCLIAKNLNFNCAVCGLSGMKDAETGGEIDGSPWVMILDEDEALARNISEALGLRLVTKAIDGSLRPDKIVFEWGVVLPPEIGQVAADFDEWHEAITWDGDDQPVLWDRADPDAIQRLKDFWPYIEEGIKEDYANASFVTEDGKLVL